MSTPNFDLLRALTHAWRERQSATVVVDTGRVKRSLHVRAGNLIGADSDAMTERLGVLLVADGRLEVSRIEPTVQRCTQSGLTFGEQLIADGLVAAEVVQRTLEQQAQNRLDRSIQTSGAVCAEPLRPAQPVFDRPLGPLVLDGFRHRFSVAFCSSVVSALRPGGVHTSGSALELAALTFSPLELRWFQQLASGQGVTSVLDRAAEPEAALRFVAALVGLGVMQDGTVTVDPVQAWLRTA